VIHHLSTPARRVKAVEALLETLRLDGRALIFVWALEQKDSRRGWDTGHDQDVMVPWVMKVGQAKPQKGKKSKDVATQPKTSVDTPVSGEQAQASTPEDKPTGDRTFHRYYHLYKSGELEQDIVEAGGVVVESGYERDNWWAILSRG
jgi:tRNA (uracil-5-)-methyltransferase TRM9